MNIDIEAVIQALEIFTTDESKYFHTCLGIKDNDANMILTWSEEIVNDYLSLDSGWDVPDVITDLLLATKFHGLNSTQALYFLMHGYYTLASQLESADFFVVGENLKAKDLPASSN